MENAAKNCNSMAEIRAEIDRMDDLILPLMAERAGYVAQAPKFKSTIEDVIVQKRIDEIAFRMRDEAANYGLNQKLAENIWRALIDQHIKFEQDEFRKMYGGDKNKEKDA
ncbi:MAG: chorismate mutase [Rhizobiales bacterium]|nr:chorismate mutase [Hyphomicrobiales bacterium]